MSDKSETAGNIEVVFVCSTCSKENPFGGCDAGGCIWRAEAIAEAIREGASVNVVCDETNTSVEDCRLGKLNVTIEAYRKPEGSA